MPPSEVLEVLAGRGPGATPIRSTCLSATNGIHVFIASRGTAKSTLPAPELMQRFTMSARSIPKQPAKKTSMVECATRPAPSIETDDHDEARR